MIISIIPYNKITLFYNSPHIITLSKKYCKTIERRWCSYHFSGVSESGQMDIRKHGIVDIIGEHHVFSTFEKALNYAKSKVGIKLHQEF